MYVRKSDLGVWQSLDPTDLPCDVADCLEDPDLTAVSGIECKYWKLDGSDIVEMSQAEKDTVDTPQAADSDPNRDQ